MSRFLLVHGTAHGAWCWAPLIPELEALGHTVETLDLPGAGEDSTPLAEVTLARYADAVLDALARDDTPAILVGHSAGGFAIAAAAERDPRHIARLVYLCAYVPVPGMGLVAMRKAAPEDLLRGAFEVNADRSAYRFKPEALAANIYHDCPPEAVEGAAERQSWQPLAPQIEPVVYTGRGADLPRSYILCEGDRTIPPTHQRAMAADFPAEDVHAFPTGHAPFVAAPAALAALLDRISAAAPPSA